MSFHVFFSMSTGLTTPIKVPAGTKKGILDHIAHIENVLLLKPTKYKDNPVHWDSFGRQAAWKDINDDLLCSEVESHNLFVRRTYEGFAHWSEHPFKVGKGHQDTGPNRAYPAGWKSETITPEDAVTFWHGLKILVVPIDRWSKDYYRARMETAYSVMRGRPREGEEFDAKPLTIEQAAAVILVFDQYLDQHDLRLTVPNGCDDLKSSYDGGYTWCEKCGAVDEDDLNDRIRNCRTRKCPIKAEFGEEDRDL